MNLIVEVGSTVTKVDLFDGNIVKRLKEVTILFKKNYLIENKIKEDDFNKLIELINNLKEEYKEIYVCGTSIFRTLDKQEKQLFLERFKILTGYEFHIISQEDESKLTVIGTCGKVKERVCCFIAGGGSTEIVVYEDGKILEQAFTNIGVIDVLKEFPDLSNDIPTSSLEEVIKYVRSKLNFPKQTADIFILAGGAHERFVRRSGFSFEKNILYDDINAPIMMDIATRQKDTKKYYEETSLDKIKASDADPKWWDATRVMCAFVLAIAFEIKAKYIIPTNIGMAQGIINELK